MNTLAKKSVLLVLAAMAAAAAGSAMADGFGGVRVRADDLTLADPADAAVLYGRIRRAARAICANTSTAGLSATKTCEQRTIDHTVTQIDSPQVTAVHRNQTQRVAQTDR